MPGAGDIPKGIICSETHIGVFVCPLRESVLTPTARLMPERTVNTKTGGEPRQTQKKQHGCAHPYTTTSSQVQQVGLD